MYGRSKRNMIIIISSFTISISPFSVVCLFRASINPWTPIFNFRRRCPESFLRVVEISIDSWHWQLDWQCMVIVAGILVSVFQLRLTLCLYPIYLPRNQYALEVSVRICWDRPPILSRRCRKVFLRVLNWLSAKAFYKSQFLRAARWERERRRWTNTNSESVGRRWGWTQKFQETRAFHVSQLILILLYIFIVNLLVRGFDHDASIRS